MVPFLLGLILILIVNKPAWANSGVVINEFLAHPSAESDWVELFNPTGQTFNLNGWKLQDSAASPMKEFGPTDEIGPNSYLVVTVSDRLNNSGDTITLLDQNGAAVDSYAYSSSALETSIGRSPDGSTNWLTFPSPSKGISNGVSNPPPPTTIPTGISLSEFLPNPDTGGQEWVELFNDNLITVNVTGFKIDDIEGGSSAYSIPEETIPAKGYLFVYLPTSILNNDTDSIRLLDPNGTVVESFTYQKATRNYSWAKSSGSWEETSTPTLGTSNRITIVAGASTTPTKTVSTKAEPTSKKASPTPTSNVLAAKTNSSPITDESTPSASSSSTVSTIKLDLKDKPTDEVKVLESSYSKYLSYGLMLLGAVVILSPAYIYIKKKRG